MKTKAGKIPVSGFKLESLSDVLARPDVPPDYLVDGLLVRGTYNVINAKPKVGKSTLARALCFAVSRGAEFLGRKVGQGSCIYLALEEREQELRGYFRAMGATGEEPIFIHADAAPAEGITALLNLVRDWRPALVVIDPLFCMVRTRDEKAYSEVYGALIPLINVSRETGTIILATHHAGKSEKADVIDSGLGSTALGGAASTTIYLKRSDNYRSITTRQRIGQDMPETILSFDAETLSFSLGGTRADEDRDAVAREIAEYLKSSEGEKVEDEICGAVEGTTGVKRKALRSLVVGGVVLRAGTGKRGDPFKYSISRSQDIPGTSKRETEDGPETRVNIDRKLVRENSEEPFLVPANLQGDFEKQRELRL
jgi:hypothetical protein